jgi:hypothetical protein
VRRVLVLPFKVGDALPEQADALRAALAQSLRDACGFDVIAPAETELPRSTRDDLANGGGRDTAGLIRLHREWDADAALFGRLAFGRVNSDPAVGIELELIDARDGARLWSAKDSVDARDPATTRIRVRRRRSPSIRSRASFPLLSSGPSSPPRESRFPGPSRRQIRKNRLKRGTDPPNHLGEQRDPRRPKLEEPFP